MGIIRLLDGKRCRKPCESICAPSHSSRWDFCESATKSNARGVFLSGITAACKVIDSVRAARRAKSSKPMPLTILFPTRPQESGLPIHHITMRSPIRIYLTSSLSGSGAHYLTTRYCVTHSIQPTYSRPKPLKPCRTKSSKSTVDQKREWFEETMAEAFTEGRRILSEDGVGSRCFCPQDHRRLGSSPFGNDPGRLDYHRFLAYQHREYHTPARSRFSGTRHQRPPRLPPLVRKHTRRGLGRCVARASQSCRRLDGAFAGRRNPRRGPGLCLHRTSARNFQSLPHRGDCRGPRSRSAQYLEKVWEVVGRTHLQQVLGTAEAKARNGLAGALEEDAA